MKNISRPAVFPRIEYRGNSMNYFRNSFLGHVRHVRSKETARVEAVDSGVGRFLRRHEFRVFSVRGVGSSWNENGAPGGVRRELVSPAHFSRGRPPENRLSHDVGRPQCRAQCYTFPILASHPFQSSLERWAANGPHPLPLVAENEGGIVTIIAERNAAALYAKKMREMQMRETRKNLRSRRFVHLSFLRMSVVGSTKKREDFGSCASGNSGPSGTNGSEEASDLSPLCAK